MKDFSTNILTKKKNENKRKAEVSKVTNDDNHTIDFSGLDFGQLTAVPGKVKSLNSVLSDIDVDWYEEVDLSVVYITNEFLCKRFSNVNIFHVEATYSTTDSWYDETIPISNVSNNTFDRIRFNDQPDSQSFAVIITQIASNANHLLVPVSSFNSIQDSF